jgi:hypothetical protein
MVLIGLGMIPGDEAAVAIKAHRWLEGIDTARPHFEGVD